jgi:hypothetical protein
LSPRPHVQDRHIREIAWLSFRNSSSANYCATLLYHSINFVSSRSYASYPPMSWDRLSQFGPCTPRRCIGWCFARSDHLTDDCPNLVRVEWMHIALLADPRYRQRDLMSDCKVKSNHIARGLLRTPECSLGRQTSKARMSRCLV